ncbi:GIN domain-containing protein [Bacteroidota bacterium]
MKKLIVMGIILVFAGVFPIFAQVSVNKENSESPFGVFHELADFNSVTISGTMLTVHLLQGNKVGYSVKNSGVITDNISIKQDGRKLIIEGKSQENLDLMLYVANLTGIVANDLVIVKTENRLTTDSLKIMCDGTPSLNLELDVKTIYTHINGASTVDLSGVADSHYIQVDGTAKINSKELMTKKVVLNIGGVSDVVISATEEITGEISGAAQLSFYGDPKVDDIRVTGTAVFRGKGETANNNDNIKETVNFKIGGYNFDITEDEGVAGKNKEQKNHKEKEEEFEYKSWAGIGFGINGYLNPMNSTEVPLNYNFLDLNYGIPVGVELNLFEKDIPIIDEYVQIVTGLGFDFTNYRFSNNTRLLYNPDSIAGIIDSQLQYSKTKLRVTYLTLPVLLELNTNKNPKKALHISAGILIGYNLNTKSKIVYVQDGNKKKVKTKEDYHINPLRYGLTGRIGIGENVALYANYAFSPLFLEGEGPELNPFTVGLQFLFN